MPKIAAANIEEHVRLQEGRILEVARKLFGENGYRGTDMGEIAKSMGLARNSLYRYYASKDHILVAVIRHDMDPYVERAEGLEVRFPVPLDRIDAWLDMQIELATGPCHATMKMLGDMGDISGELRKELGLLHEPPREALELAVADLLAGTGRDAHVISAMIFGMTQQAGALAMQSRDAEPVIGELKRSVKNILNAN